MSENVIVTLSLSPEAIARLRTWWLTESINDIPVNVRPVVSNVVGALRLAGEWHQRPTFKLGDRVVRAPGTTYSDRRGPDGTGPQQGTVVEVAGRQLKVWFDGDDQHTEKVARNLVKV